MPTVAQGRIISLSGDDLRHLIASATLCLERNAEAINALNVFPVPDGDTGINMLLTMRSVQERLAALDPHAPVSQVAQAAAHGALLGARGNSGVILSQFFQGLAQGLSQCHECGGQDLARGFQLGAQAAYKAVGSPVEGTMLTVLREVSQEVANQQPPGGDLRSLWEVACRTATEALARTPEQLPVLREAGVVDAGGQGIVAILEGGGAFLRGEDVGELAIVAPAEGAVAGAVSQDFLAATEEELYGYCTQFLLQGENLDVAAIRDRMATMAQSAVVVGDATLLKVHVHTSDPGPILSYAVSLGTLSHATMDNMDEQHREFVATQRRRQEVAPLEVVAVAWGDGLERLFRNLGAAAIIPGGQTMNPSTEEVLGAVNSVAAREVMLLPNNPNIIPVAQQAARLASRPLRVIPTSTIPQGLSALLAFNPQEDAEANAVAMAQAMEQVRTGQVTTAVRSTSANGLKVRRGQVIGLLEDRLVAVGNQVAPVVQRLLEQAHVTPDNLVTLYWGGDLNQAQAESIVQGLGERMPHTELELVAGEQPYYHFILSIE